jgi:hypothetical protein
VRVIATDSVPPEQRMAVRETVAAMLGPILQRHPQFADLVVLIGKGPSGWTVNALTLDPLGLDVQPEPGLSPDLLEAVRELLRNGRR